MSYGIVVFFTLLGFLKACSLTGEKVTAEQQFADALVSTIALEEHQCEDSHSHELNKEQRSPSSLFADSTHHRSIVQKRSIASLEELVPLLGTNGCEDMNQQELDDVIDLMTKLGGRIQNPMDYPETVAGLQEFLDEVGVSPRFSAHEMVTPNNISVAQRCGFQQLLPKRCRWLSAAVQGLLATELRAVINNGNENGGNGITLRNWWRPQCYNKGVGGAGSSDHMQARGFDLDFTTPQQRAQAQNLLCKMYKENPFSLQVGIGCKTLHIGVGSPKRLRQYPDDGSRFWTYSSLQSCPIKRLSSDDCWRVERESGKLHIHSLGDKIQTSGAL